MRRNGMALRGWALNGEGKAWKGVAMTREGNDELRVAGKRKGIDRRCNGEAKTGREME